MHSPEVLAHRILQPWPEALAGEPKPGYRKNGWSYGFLTAAGRSWYFPALVEIWHIEPNGADALQGECRNTRWQWHIHHWSISVPLIGRWRRRILTRCAWCGGRDRKRDPVNCSNGHRGPRPPWWRGENGLYHHDCSSVYSAHRLCLCDTPLLDHGDYGKCAFCGKYRGFRQEPTIPSRYLASLPAGIRIPPEKQAWLESEWEKLRAEREASDA